MVDVFNAVERAQVFKATWEFAEPLVPLYLELSYSEQSYSFYANLVSVFLILSVLAEEQSLKASMLEREGSRS